MVGGKLAALEETCVEGVLELLKKIVVLALLGNAAKFLSAVGHMMMVDVV